MPGKLGVANKNCSAKREARLPETGTMMRSFLGMCNVFRRFVSNFYGVPAPLTALPVKGTPFSSDQTTEEQRDSFELRLETITIKTSYTVLMVLRRA